MLKNDEHMKKVRAKLVIQQTSINKFEERKRRTHDKKFAKQIKAHNMQEKHRKKKRALEEIEQWKKSGKEPKKGMKKGKYEA